MPSPHGALPFRVIRDKTCTKTVCAVLTCSSVGCLHSVDSHPIDIERLLQEAMVRVGVGDSIRLAMWLGLPNPNSNPNPNPNPTPLGWPWG